MQTQAKTPIFNTQVLITNAKAAEHQTATNKKWTQANKTELMLKIQRAVTQQKNQQEAKAGNRQSWQQEISPEKSAGKLCIMQRNNLAQKTGQEELMYWR